MQIRVVTYNIHKGIGGVDRKYRPERIVETLEHYAPDIVFMQEVDNGVPRSRFHCQLDWFGDALDLRHRVYQANVRLRQGHYGNAILSRFPLSDIVDFELTIPLKKRRRAIGAKCHVHFGGHERSVALVNFHLGLAGFERAIQLKKLLGCEFFSHTHRATPMIVGGDLNDVWGNLGTRFLVPAGLTAASGPIHTFPAMRPLRPLDRLFFRGNLKCNHCFRSRSKVAAAASDHLPIIAEFELTDL